MSRRLFRISLILTVIAAVCYFTPILVWLIAMLGLSTWLVWIDYVLPPLLGMFAALTLIAYIRMRNE